MQDRSSHAAETTATSPVRSVSAVLGWLTALVCAGMPPPARAAEVSIRTADVRTILREIKRPGAKAVLVNVWATWCDPCRKEMPALLKFFREHGGDGLRLVLVSADDQADRDKAIRFLASQGVDFPTWMKRDDDMTFIDALDAKWSGALPASFLLDGRCRVRQHWYGEIDLDGLRAAWDELAPRRKGRAP